MFVKRDHEGLGYDGSGRKTLQDALREEGKPKRGSALDVVRDLIGCVSGPPDLSVNKAHLKTFGR